ncbi:MAG TPA: HAD-IIIA family hydrolase [Phnomibacter sp.]|nr:HAD-IIIA family hydrolase [Phnomibacter sp.]
MDTTAKDEVIILAGGLGTRLQSISGDTPKCLMPVNGQPFLHYLVQHLRSCGFRHFVFALSESQISLRSFLEQYEKEYKLSEPSVSFSYSIENTPLGTGGALLQALQFCNNEQVLAVNGDSIVLANPFAALQVHLRRQATCTLLATYMQNADRYGLVHFDQQHRLLSFTEKKTGSIGYVNAGVYWLNKTALQNTSFPLSFSWEQSFLQASAFHANICIYPVTGYFIDIGIPEDYARAQQDFTQQYMLQPGKGWTLFLDRDGVINIEKENDYIHSWDEFHFYDDAISSIAALSKIFDRIVIVTNQKGVGKGVTKWEDLQDIHRKMEQTIEAGGGKIDAIYFCPDLEDSSPNRKPNAGMAYQAKADFPSIQFHRSVIVGNNLSDMYFGRNAGMHTVFLRTTQPELEIPGGLADMEIDSLHHLIQAWIPGASC